MDENEHIEIEREIISISLQKRINLKRSRKKRRETEMRRPRTPMERSLFRPVGIPTPSRVGVR